MGVPAHAVSSTHALDLIRIQMALECIAVNDAGELIRIPGANPDDIARLYAAQYDGGYLSFPRHDLSEEIRQALCALPAEVAFHNRAAVQAILHETDPDADIFVGKSYVFPATIGPEDYPDAVRLGGDHSALIDPYDPELDVLHGVVYAIICEGRIVSTCESSRENETAAEAWVRTLPEYRRQGYARQVTAAWAHNLQRQGKIAFYSHRSDNFASQFVARSLDLIQYQAFVAYE